jgi:hypothetical protein
MKVNITVFMAAWSLMAGAGLAQAGEMAPVKEAGITASKGTVQNVMSLTDEQIDTVSAGSGQDMGSRLILPAVPPILPNRPGSEEIGTQSIRWH